MKMFSIEDELIINEILKNRKVADHVIKGGIYKLLKNWKNFVKECEEGYKLTIDDYTNDLCTRDIIQDVLDQVDVRLARIIHDEIKEFDDRLKKLLINTEKCVFGDCKDERRFWFFGIIKTAKGELLEDAIIDGFKF